MEVVGENGKKPIQLVRAKSDKDRIKVKRKTLEAVLQECQIALELLSTTGSVEDEDTDDSYSNSDVDRDAPADDSCQSSSAPTHVTETDELRDLLKSRVECPDFLQKLEKAQASVPQNLAEEGSSWDMVDENDLWEGGNPELDKEDYVLVKQEDIVDGIACFMAAYLLSLKQTKDLTPNQLQEGQLIIAFFQHFSMDGYFLKRKHLHACSYWHVDSLTALPSSIRFIERSDIRFNFTALSKTFSVKKRKGKLRKAWDGSKVIYNVASWGATAIGIYQNPAILRAASAAFWTSCRVISKLF